MTYAQLKTEIEIWVSKLDDPSVVANAINCLDRALPMISKRIKNPPNEPGPA